MRFRRNSLVFHRGWQALRFLLKPSGEEFVLSSEFFAPLNDRRLVHLPSRLFQSLFSLGKGDLQPVINENIFGPGSVNGSTERFIDPTLLSLPIEFTQPPHEVGKFPLFVRTFFFWLLHEPSLFTQAGGGALRTSVGGRLGDPESSLRLPKDLFGRATEPRPFGFRIGRIREDNPIPKLRETTPPIFDFNRFRAFVTGGLFVKLLSEQQPLKASFPIRVTAGIVRLVREMQWKNAEAPTELTERGINKPTIELHPANASSEISAVSSGTFNTTALSGTLRS